jgi:threonine-phosphate decarboxylase
MNSTGHGGDIWGASRRSGVPVVRILDFSANINPLGVSPKTRGRLKREIDLIRHYPDVYQEELRRLVASHESVHPDCILFGNGATQLIHLVPRGLECRKALIVEPSFSEYRATLKSCKAAVVEFHTDPKKNFQLDLEVLLRTVQTKRPDMIVVGNPNNPTGKVIPRQEFLRMIKFCTNQKVNLVVDESFIEFAEESSLATVAAGERRLIVLRSFTKCFALAGLRIGYLVAHQSIVKKLALIMEPWSVNTLALAAAVESMKDSGHFRKCLALIRKERHYLSEGIASLGWLRPFPSEVNYLLVHIEARSIDGAALRRKLEADNILIRDATGFRGLGPRYIRIAVRSHKENHVLLCMLDEIGRRLRLNREVRA